VGKDFKNLACFLVRSERSSISDEMAVPIRQGATLTVSIVVFFVDIYEKRNNENLIEPPAFWGLSDIEMMKSASSSS
jgi:hypothetical protein